MDDIGSSRDSNAKCKNINIICSEYCLRHFRFIMIKTHALVPMAKMSLCMCMIYEMFGQFLVAHYATRH